jgi:hypothetical protein
MVGGPRRDRNSPPGPRRRESAARLLRTRIGALIRCAVCVGGLACWGQGSDDVPGSTIATRVEESTRYGEDRVTGLLHVTDTEAYIESGPRRLGLVSAAPITAVGLEALLAQTAAELRPRAGARVRARGDLQGDVLWDAQVTRLD